MENIPYNDLGFSPQNILEKHPTRTASMTNICSTVSVYTVIIYFLFILFDISLYTFYLMK